MPLETTVVDERYVKHQSSVNVIRKTRRQRTSIAKYVVKQTSRNTVANERHSRHPS